MRLRGLLERPRRTASGHLRYCGGTRRSLWCYSALYCPRNAPGWSHILGLP